MRKSNLERRGVALWGLSVIVAFLFLAGTPVMFADEGTQAEKGGFFSGVSKGLSNLIPSNLFSELSPEDVGFKPRIKPHFAFTQGFTSNARLGANQADAAWQARVAPGITVSVPSGKLYTEVDYTYGFSTTQGSKTAANINTHNINALARYDLSEDTIIGVGNNIQLSEVPGEPGEPFVLETATAQVKHRIGPKLTASLTDTLQYFGDKSITQQNDFVDNGVALALPYDATADLALGPTFSWNTRDFDKDNNKDYWQIQPGIATTYRLGPKTTFSANFGWTLRKFSEKQGQNDKDSELVYGMGVNHKLGQKLIWSFAYAKTLVDTFETNFVFRDTPQSSTLDNLDRNFRVLKSHRLGSAATYHWNEKNSFGAFGDFQFTIAEASDNIITKRDNDEKAMEVGTNYTYRFNRYITFDVVYSFGRRFSAENTVGRNEYTFHKLSGGVNISI